MSVRQSVRALLRERPRVVLAVSGGLDSMVLLDAAAATVPAATLVVATFDHGTGPAATAAAALVVESASQRGLRVEHGRAAGSLAMATVAQLRAARWAFLRGVAATFDGVVATAHTLDDQIETVLMRVVRGAGARGLAGLFTSADVARPLIRFGRRDLARYARTQGLV